MRVSRVVLKADLSLGFKFYHLLFNNLTLLACCLHYLIKPRPIAWRSQGDSNARTRLRRPVLYPLSYGSMRLARQLRNWRRLRVESVAHRGRQPQCLEDLAGLTSIGVELRGANGFACRLSGVCACFP